MIKIFLKSVILVLSLLSIIYGIDNLDSKEHITNYTCVENTSAEQAILEEKKWKIGGKIHFEENGTTEYLGTIEINKLTREVLKEFFNIRSDICPSNAKLLIKNENDTIILTHYSERNAPEKGEELHATLLYTNKRVDNGHETLKDIYQNLQEMDKDLPNDRVPSVKEIADVYYKIIKSDTVFEISHVIFVKGKTSSCIIAKLLCDGKDEILNTQGNPISGNFLHMSLVNVDKFIDNERIDLVVKKLRKQLLGKKIKIADKQGIADLEFGVTGSKPEDRIRPWMANIQKRKNKNNTYSYKIISIDTTNLSKKEVAEKKLLWIENKIKNPNKF